MPSLRIFLALLLPLTGCFNKTIGAVYAGTGALVIAAGAVNGATEEQCGVDDEYCEDSPDNLFLLVGGLALVIAGFVSIVTDPDNYGDKARAKPAPRAAPRGAPVRVPFPF